MTEDNKNKISKILKLEEELSKVGINRYVSNKGVFYSKHPQDRSNYTDGTLQTYPENMYSVFPEHKHLYI